MDATGANLRRAASGPLADSPHWSPIGHLIVFTQLEKKFFDLDLGSGDRKTLPSPTAKGTTKTPLGPRMGGTSFPALRGETSAVVGDGRRRFQPAPARDVPRRVSPLTGDNDKRTFYEPKRFSFPWRIFPPLISRKFSPPPLVSNRGACRGARRWRAKVWA